VFEFHSTATTKKRGKKRGERGPKNQIMMKGGRGETPPTLFFQSPAPFVIVKTRLQQRAVAETEKKKTCSVDG
jgi:hypothetical protein